MQFFCQQRVRNTNQHGGICVRTRCNPLSIHEFCAVVMNWIDADDPSPFFLQRLKASLADVIGDVPAVF